MRKADVQKSPEEMSVEELNEALKEANSRDAECKEILGADWCRGFFDCDTCRYRLLILLKAAHEREAEEAIELIKDARDEYMRLSTENGIMLDELIRRQDRMDKLERQVADLTNERDVLQKRLEELSDAGITSLHRLLRETVGEAKNITDAARIYVENARERRKPDPEPTLREFAVELGQASVDAMSRRAEREAVIERLRELDFSTLTGGSHVALSKIGYAILEDSAPWHPALLTALRDKLIELLSYEKAPDGE